MPREVERVRAPDDVRHNWHKRHGATGVYDCDLCNSWTANLPLYRYEVCPELDRRKSAGDRRVA